MVYSRKTEHSQINGAENEKTEIKTYIAESIPKTTSNNNGNTFSRSVNGTKLLSRKIVAHVEITSNTIPKPNKSDAATRILFFLLGGLFDDGTLFAKFTIIYGTKKARIDNP